MATIITGGSATQLWPCCEQKSENAFLSGYPGGASCIAKTLLTISVKEDAKTTRPKKYLTFFIVTFCFKINHF